MPDSIEVSDVKIRLLDSAPGGVAAMASCVVSRALYLNNIAIRRSPAGGFALAFPHRFSKSGIKHYDFCPVSRRARAALEEAILSRLDLSKRRT